jgi:DNA primase
VIEERPCLTLADLEAYDPRSPARPKERRFCCPLPACRGKRVDAMHRSLSVNVESGAWHCWRCGAAGKLQDYWRPRERLSSRQRALRTFGLTGSSVRTQRPAVVAARADEPAKPPAWRAMWDRAPLVVGTPGEAYLRSRGLPVEVATRADVRYFDRWPHWAKDEADGWRLEGTSRRVVFPIVDRAGELVGIQGRAIDEDHLGEKVMTRGSAGVFSTAPLADVLKSSRVLIVEAPIDALSIAAVGVLPALATCGTSVPAWLPPAFAFKWVALGHDNDVLNHLGQRPGDVAAARAASDFRAYGATVERWRPSGAKDWNELLLRHGVEVLGRDLAAGQLDQVDGPVAQADAVDAADAAAADESGTEFTVRRGSEPGVIAIRDPFTGEWLEVEAALCPPAWRRAAWVELQEQTELWDPP